MGKTFIYKQIRLNLAWDQAPHCEKKEKKSALAKKRKSTSEANREVVWVGERVIALPPPPQDAAWLAWLADIFPI